MALITVNMSMVKSHGNDDVPFTDDGFITLTPVAHGVYDGSMRAPEPIERTITRGVMPELELAPGQWRIKVEPNEARSWPPYVVDLKEGMVEPVNLATLAPSVVVDGRMYAKGDDGESAYDIAKELGFVGTEAEWIASLNGDAYEVAKKEGYVGTRSEWLMETKGSNVGISMEVLADNSVQITGPGVEVLSDGSVLLLSSTQPNAVAPWSVNDLALRAGRPILSLFHDPVADCLYSGYGDWSENGDEIGVVRHDLLTGQSETVYFPRSGENKTWPTHTRNGAFTEAILSFYRSKSGSMYIPHIDGAGYYEGCGYITNEGGVWHEVSLPHQAIHVFHTVENSQGLWMSGSALHEDQKTAGPAIWFRPTGGTWYRMYLEPMVTNTLGFERYYKMQVINDRVFVVAAGDIALMPNWAKRGFKYVPQASGEPYEGTILPTGAYDMQTSAVTDGERYQWNNNYYTDSVTVNGWNYYGGTEGRIMRKKASA